MVVRKKLDNLSLKGIFHAKEDELNSLEIRFLKMNFEFKQFYFYYFFIWDFGLLQIYPQKNLVLEIRLILKKESWFIRIAEHVMDVEFCSAELGTP